MKRLLIFLFIFNQVHASQHNEIWLFGTKEQVFTQQHRMLSIYEIKHYIVDSGREFEKTISQGLSSDKEVALQQIKQRFDKNKTQWTELGKKSWQGAVNAQAIGIEKLPAITFDQGQSVIYGLTDLSQAYQIYRNYLDNLQQ